ncbi:SpoIIE family protein phosphatase [Marinobacter fonticola]|uniref:SpoIIE family protein phosphatase n=1 Tax=Marinobacter fonticola TaxID=2603215 RepID=UPI0011E72BCD|nr:SpoIIE family protein phosphatase [Marinobacter fonticola]
MRLRLDHALVTQSHANEEPGVCGDAGLINAVDEDLFIALIDGLGHGQAAHDVASRAKKYLSQAYRKLNLVDVMQGLHEHLRRSLGAVVALCRIDASTGMLQYVGVGNISVKIYAPNPITFVPRDGIVGYIMSRPREETLILSPGTVLVLHSDGLPAHLDLSEALRPDESSAQQMAERLLRDYGKEDDDGSCIVVKVN